MLDDRYHPSGAAGKRAAAIFLERVNAAFDDMLKSGELASFALTAHMTYLPPRQPYILDGISMSDLAK